MKTRVYYGAYTLSYWIKLMLTRQVVLPEYQRYFVWEKEQLIALIDSLRSGRFVPPITIGSYTENGSVHNNIIDGQQRLSSIILAWLDLFPNKEKFQTDNANLANEDSDDTEDSEKPASPREWRYDLLLSDGSSARHEIVSRLPDGCYEKLNLALNDDFFEETYVGFSYIVPMEKDSELQQAYYSRVFRDLNLRGIHLKELDSRRALYFLKVDYDKFFDPEFLHDVVHVTTFGNAKKERLDFVRYLSLVSEYAKRDNYDSVGRGSRRYSEHYYESYVAAMVGIEDDSRFLKVRLTIEKGKPIPEIERLKKAFQALSLAKEYTSIIDMDLNFFGLVYWVLIKGRELKDACQGMLKSELKSKSDAIKSNASVSKAPSALRNLRDRMKISIDIYKEFLK